MQAGGKGGRERGARTLSKKEKEAAAKAKEEEARKKEEEKQKKREEKLLGIKPSKKDRAEKAEEPLQEEETTVEKKDKHSKKTKSEKLEKKKEREKTRLDKQKEIVVDEKIENTQNVDNNNAAEGTEPVVDEPEKTEKVKKVAYVPPPEKFEDFENIEEHKKAKKVSHEVKQVNFDFTTRSGNISLKDIPKDVRKKDFPEEDRLDFVYNYLSQWSDPANYSEYPYNKFSQSDQKDFQFIMGRVGVSKRKALAKSLSETCSTVGGLCLLEGLSLQTDTIKFPENEVETNIFHFLTMHDVYKSFSCILSNFSALKSRPVQQQDEMLTFVQNEMKKVRVPDCVSLKAFKSVYPNTSPELSEKLGSLIDLDRLLFKKVTKKIFEFSLKSLDVTVTERMLVIDPECYEHWDDLVLQNLEPSEKLLTKIKNNEKIEMKLFCQRSIDNFNNNTEAKNFVRLCKSIVVPINYWKIAIVASTVMVCVVASIYVIFMN
ncbi:hypothetical protein EIN_060830 [Entamoeba invadens IP1]|uniref:Uncharacterized protein n=1 Tax=Entamoeba invadens TaxID=33085 RepID=S0B1T2_ENTIV|nr:hypothetical protein EIN_060830 [Entamoeba invadens IP1]ELP93528.1 hypothetical protein EIN_060830 [Entamoeba invadens IP1]BAN41755.1 hypothetical protein [Entamoeba invadens]|eukprot:XP_004260299.1 hypothetical protein EIN_060830 [Entamoeba invadens IP1]